jgi:hypothetical protein
MVRLQFIATDKRLYTALLQKNWKEVARLYNGPNYWVKGYDKKVTGKPEIKFRK